MEPIWLSEYPEGIGPEIDPSQYQSIVHFFNESCDKFRDKVAYSNMGTTLTFDELDRLSADFASFLQNKAGLKKGDRIAIQLPNLLQFPVVFFGALRAGLIVVNTNPLYTPREMEHQFKDSGAKTIVILANFAHQLEEILPRTNIETVVVTQLGDLLGWPKSLVVNAAVKYLKKMVPAYRIPEAIDFFEALDFGRAQAYQPVDVNSEDPAFFQYTGGTTGVSKGAVLTHRNIIANMLQIRAWMSLMLREGEEVVITALPLYHIFCMTVNNLALMSYGAHNLMVTNPRDIPTFIKILKKNKFTVMSGVNTLFNALMNDPHFKEVDFSLLKISVAGGMALQTAVAERWKKETNSLLIEGYGLTEASPVVCCNPVNGTDVPGSIGLPLPSTQIKIIDEEGNELNPGEEGELCVKGPQVMQGYYDKPDETEKVFTTDGWLKTGDIATVNEKGWFRIVDRKKDMILVSGFNVFPNEVEDVVVRHEKIMEAAAIGVPDNHSGEIVKIFVVKKDQQLTEAEVISHCRDHLAGYKVPKVVEFRDELPKTNVGKILRRALRGA